MRWWQWLLWKMFSVQYAVLQEMKSGQLVVRQVHESPVGEKIVYVCPLWDGYPMVLLPDGTVCGEFRTWDGYAESYRSWRKLTPGRAVPREKPLQITALPNVDEMLRQLEASSTGGV